MSIPSKPPSIPETPGIQDTYAISTNTQSVGYKAKAFERRNLLFYFLLALGLPWIMGALTAIFHIKTPTGITDPAILFFVFIGIPCAGSPTLAAFVMTAVAEGKPGVKALWKRFWNRNMSLKWLLVTLLFYETLRLVANLSARAIDGQAYPILQVPDQPWMLITSFVIAFISSGIGEEFGWRGYVLPRFQVKWNALTSSLILGVIWASWHIPAFLMPGQPLYQRNFLEWAPLIVLPSIIYTWIFNNTKGSVLAAALFHASFNASIIVLPTYSSLWVYLSAMLLSVILITLVFGPKNLVRQKPEKGIEKQGIGSLANG